MKIRNLIILLISAAFIFSSTSAEAMTKKELRVAYVLKNLGVKREIQAQLRPILIEYLNAKKEANKTYDAMKQKYEFKIENDKLSESEAEALLNAKWAAATAELNVKKTYDKKIRQIISAKKTYKCFSLLNDKASKFNGGKKGAGEADEDE